MAKDKDRDRIDKETLQIAAAAEKQGNKPLAEALRRLVQNEAPPLSGKNKR